MTSLQKKERKFFWTTKCKEIFQNIKQLLTNAPILQIADPNGDFVVWKNVSKEGIGGVLMQNDCVIYYESQKLKNMNKIIPP